MSKDMTQDTIGKILTGPAEDDAIHIAVTAVDVIEMLWPGQRVTVAGGQAPAKTGGDPIGIIDPFLGGPIHPGQRCWVFLFPNTITGLRHQWTHPVLTPQNESRRWLEEFCRRYSHEYTSLLEQIKDGYVTFGTEYYREENDDLWYHYERATGTHVSPDDRERVTFRCAC